MANDDFIFLKALCIDFFEEYGIRKKIKEIRSFKKWGGFERWWQIEFALYLEKKNDLGEIKGYCREALIYIKQNGEVNKKRIHLDFKIKKNKAKKDLCLELKCNKRFDLCLSGLNNDLNLYLKARKKYVVSDKNIFLAGICDPKHGRKIYDEVSIKSEIKNAYDINSIHVSKIGRTGLLFFLF